MMSGYEPEVSLAVRIPKSHETTGLVEDNSERESNTDIDTILMSYGFEYIDTTGEVPLRRTVDAGDEFRSTEGLYTVKSLRSCKLWIEIDLFDARYTSSSSGVGCPEHYYVAFNEIRSQRIS